ncbi:MAG: hypothetical protein Kow00107_04520 [Planctomycetota bacterium]
MTDYRGREIPWLPVIRFHKEIVIRAEEGFFSLCGRDGQDERWTSLRNFDPDNLAGPWQIDSREIQSRHFQLTLEQGQHENLFLGGPCFLGWSKSVRGGWVPQWRPLLYREIELRPDGSLLEVVPKEGSWNVTPLLSNLLDRLEMSVGGTRDEFATRVIEKATAYRRLEQAPLGRCIFRAFFSEVPDAEVELTKKIRRGTFDVQPTPWVLFAPASNFSALTRHLIRDYERLEELLIMNPEQIGGLRLLEDRPTTASPKQTDVLPLVPLNDSQRLAVQRILEERPLTVISGPPGTGKSQVVVSLLLNAWARGRTVLFASNNNKAVDVVRERVERFESEFPIAVRAGAKQKQNIQEVLRRTLNMASAIKREDDADFDVEKLRRRRKMLVDQRRDLQNALETKLPQRIDESRKTALRAYGEYRSTLASIAAKEREFAVEKAELGFEGMEDAKIEAAVQKTANWLQRIQHFKELIVQDNRRRQELQSRIADRERRRDRAVEEVGLVRSEAGDWKWLLTGPGPELLADWDQRFRAMLDGPVEQELEPLDWRDAFDRWKSAEHANGWAVAARKFAELVLRACIELAPKLEEVRKLSAAVEEGRSKVNAIDVPTDVELPMDHVHGWMADFAEYATRERGGLDFLPWSQRSRLRRSLRRHERHLRPGLPLKVWTRIGTLNDAGREQLAPILESTRRWIELRDEWQTTQTLMSEIECRFRMLRSQAAELRIRDVPSSQSTEAWKPVVGKCRRAASIAEAAALAWRRRTEKEKKEEELRTIAKEWSRLASGVPIREAWRRGQGAQFDRAIRALADAPGPETVNAARAALYTGSLARLVECWQTACDCEQAASQLRADFMAVPEAEVHVNAWWRERPMCAFVLASPLSAWPDIEEAQRQIEAVADWCGRWRAFNEITKPSMEKKALQELEWAVAKLGKAVVVLPDGPEKSRVAEIFSRIKKNPESDWPVPDLNAAFAELSPDRLRAEIDRIESKLEKSSFMDAKAKWLERIRSDDDAIRAVDRLEKSLRKYRGVVVESEYDTFGAALRAVPIWITTAQASQSIPLAPELFDIVVIDEASQCTLTNLLPLMYRGRTLTIIGDDNQLPAIPTIQESEELALARKYGIEEHLGLVGHATNDVYKTATESLPRRRADVLMLNEHFRSNPQIIGFSNRHIYLQRLELKKDPAWGERLPVGSGVHIISVAGTTERGANGRSWINVPEAEKVLELVLRLKQGDSRSLSVGIVTPFAAHKEMLRERLDQLRLASEVLVDTAYGFQGDERDVIVFSPVVAKGIAGSASRWVESPPNLINVAITRAREALFVVGDIDYCLQQEGILRKLALYCRDIQMLRDTSAAELELFSWMVVKGWEPKVHPRVGDIEVDFILESNSGDRIAIEVDGRQHEESIEQDRARDAYLQGQGYEVLRIPAREVLETPFEVIHQIEQAL